MINQSWVISWIYLCAHPGCQPSVPWVNQDLPCLGEHKWHPGLIWAAGLSDLSERWLFFNKQPVSEHTLCAKNISSWSDTLESKGNVSQLQWKLMKAIFPAPSPCFLKSRMRFRLINRDVLLCSTNGLSLTAYILYRKKYFSDEKTAQSLAERALWLSREKFKVSHGWRLFHLSKGNWSIKEHSTITLSLILRKSQYCLKPVFI